MSIGLLTSSILSLEVAVKKVLFGHLELLEEFFKLSEDEVEDLYKKFRTASDGQKSLSRRKFSDIMHRCFPRTHKVKENTF